MQIIKITIGVISISFSSVVLLKSDETGALLLDTDSAIFRLGILILIAGILLLLTVNGVVGGLISGLIYLFAALIGFTSNGSSDDLTIWSVAALLFGLLIIWGEFYLPE